MVLSYGTFLEIHNHSLNAITNTKCTNVDPFDFVGKDRPNKKLIGRKCGANGKILQRLEIRRDATNCPYTLELTWDTKKKDVIRIYQQPAVYNDHRQILQTNDPEWRVCGDHDFNAYNIYDTYTIIVEITDNINYIINIIQQILTQVKSLIKEKDLEAALKKANEALKHAKRRNTKIEECNALITEIYNQMSDNKAQNKIADAKKDIENGKFDSALEKLMEAEKLARLQQTLNDIRKLKQQSWQAKDNSQGRNYLNQANNIDNFLEAAALYDRALLCAVDKKLLNEIRKAKEQSSNRQAQRMLNEAKGLINSGRFSEALEKLDSAMHFATDSSTLQALNAEKNNVCKARVKHIQYEGNNLLNQNKFEEALKKFNEAKAQAIDEESRLSVEKDIQKVGDKQAGQLLDVAKKLIGQNNKTEAEKSLTEAMKRAGNAQLVQAIDSEWLKLTKPEDAEYGKDVDTLKQMMKEKTEAANKEKEQIQKETQALIGESKYEAAMKKIDDAIAKTKNQTVLVALASFRSNALMKVAKSLQNEANSLRKQGKFDEANAKFDKALSATRKFAIAKSIKADKAKNLSEQAEAIFDEAFRLENESRAELAKAKFALAQSAAQQAAILNPTNEQVKNYKMINLKIEGNEQFNGAVAKVRQGQTSCDKLSNKEEAPSDSVFDKIETMFSEAMKLALRAEAAFESGYKLKARLFDESLKETKKLKSKIDMGILGFNAIKIDYNLQQQKIEIEQTEKEAEETEDQDVTAQLQIGFSK